ncbi:MAG: O-antigen ligase family protein [Actinobacteria bacterium]|nr:O-antigen ligase family protein [Actinomycetota bacterium]
MTELSSPLAAPQNRSRTKNTSALRGGFVFALIAALAFANGGYGAISWGWSSLAFLWLTVLILLLRADLRLGGLELSALAAFTGFLAWTYLSNLWTSSATRTMLEGDRTIVYVSGLAALLLVGRRTDYRALLVGVWAATALVCTYSLLTRLFPNRLGVIDPIAGYRLSEPMGYWNGLGVFAAMGALLALGFAARARTTVFRALAATSLLILIATIYFTFSRGAWIALGIGLAVTIGFDPRRLHFLATLLVLLPATGLALILAYRSPALSRVHPSLHEASAAGHRLAVWVVALAVVNAVAIIAFAAIEHRIQADRRTQRAFASLLGLLLLTALVATFATFGSPVTIARKGWDAFAAPPPRVAGSLNTRLFNLSGNNRLPVWRVAVRQFEQKPWMGSGAGTYELYWQRYRPVAGQVRDAHNLYLETLGELGIVGLVLLVLGLAPPLIAAVRARSQTLVPVALGAYVAFLMHAIVDWDWELPAVTLAALACGAAILVAARPESSTSVLPTRIRFGAAALAVPLIVFVVIGLVGNEATNSAKSAANVGDWRRVESKTQVAYRWAPWSATPLELRAEAQLAAGRVAAARRDFERAVAKDPHDWSLWFELAQSSDGRARRRALAEARRLNPLSPEIAEYLAANPTLKLQP